MKTEIKQFKTVAVRKHTHVRLKTHASAIGAMIHDLIEVIIADWFRDGKETK